MAAPLRSSASRDRIELLLFTYELFRATFREAWDALGQYGLSDHDRKP